MPVELPPLDPPEVATPPQEVSINTRTPVRTIVTSVLFFGAKRGVANAHKHKAKNQNSPSRKFLAYKASAAEAAVVVIVTLMVAADDPLNVTEDLDNAQLAVPAV